MKNKEKINRTIYNKAYYKKHKQKFNEYGIKHRKEHPEHYRNYKLKKLYGITLDEYNKMYENQKGLCLICGRTERIDTRRLNVDHCHKTKKVRGLLCGDCNRKLGWYEILKENIERYLK